MKALTDSCKFDIAVPPQAFAAATVDSRYFNLQQYRDAVFVLTVGGSIGIADRFYAEVYTAEDRDGTNAAAYDDITLGNVEVDEMPGVTHCTIEADTVINDDTITITVGGVDYTFIAADAEDIETRVFEDSDTTDAACIVSLIACINSPVYGVPGVLAEVDAADDGVLHLMSEEAGDVVFDVAVSDPTTLIPVPLEMIGYIGLGEIDASVDGFTHAMVQLDASAMATGNIQATLVRGEARHMPARQAVADSIP
jgi:hypothetical protein